MGHVVSVKEKRGRAGDADYQPRSGAVRHFWVRWSDSLATDTEILATADIPAIRSLHPDGLKWVKSKSARQRVMEPWLWDVEVQYSSNPLDLPAEIDWD